MREELEAVWAGFTDPPDEARPRAWWHWMDGNVDPEGIRLDLEWLHGVGVRGVQMFDGGMGTPLVVPDKVSVRIGGVAAGAAPGQGHRPAARARVRRRDLARLERRGRALGAPGGRDEEGGLVGNAGHRGRPGRDGLAAAARCGRPVPGPPRWGSDPGTSRYSQDWITIAVPRVAAQQALRPATVTASSPIDRPERLTDGRHGRAWPSPATRSSFLRVGRAGVRAPVTVSRRDRRPAGAGRLRRRAAAARRPAGERRRLLDGRRRAARLGRPGTDRDVPAGDGATLPAVLSGGTADDALPRLATGVRLPPVLRRVSEFQVSEFALYPGGRIHQGELKAGFGAALDYYALDTGRSRLRTPSTRAASWTSPRSSARTACCAGMHRPASGACSGSARR